MRNVAVLVLVTLLGCGSAVETVTGGAGGSEGSHGAGGAEGTSTATVASSSSSGPVVIGVIGDGGSSGPCDASDPSCMVPPGGFDASTCQPDQVYCPGKADCCPVGDVCDTNNNCVPK